jgi:hypothetical protein
MVICYQLRADVKNIWASTSTHSHCCCLNDSHQNWLVMSKWVFHLHRIFNSHNCHASSVHYHQQRFAVNVKVGIVHDFVIRPYLLHQQFSAQIYWVFWRKSYQNAGRNPIGIQKKYVVPARWVCGSLWQSGPENFSLPLNSDWWIGWGRPVAWSPQVTGPHISGLLPMGPH